MAIFILHDGLNLTRGDASHSIVADRCIHLHMDIETYAKRHPHLPSESVESHLLAWLADANYGTLLDVGCGSGRLIKALASQDLLDQACICGVDLSQTNIDLLRARLPQVEGAVDNAETLETVSDEAIDFLISTQVIEHIDDTRMLTAVRRVLKPGGTAYISTVFKRPWAKFIWRSEGGEWALDPTHVREYTEEDQLLRIVDAVGLRLLDAQMVPVSFPILDFVVRRLSLDPERVFNSRPGKLTRGVRVRIPGYFTWSLVLRKQLS